MYSTILLSKHYNLKTNVEVDLKSFNNKYKSWLITDFSYFSFINLNLLIKYNKKYQFIGIIFILFQYGNVIQFWGKTRLRFI